MKSKITYHNSHDPINKSHRKKIWILFTKRDALRYSMLEKSNIIVVKIPNYECKNIFKEKINYLSFLEVCNMLYIVGVKA